MNGTDQSPKKANQIGLKEKMEMNPIQQYILFSITLYLTL